MSLGTFGSVIKFAIRLEKEAMNYYEKIVDNIMKNDKKLAFEAIIKQSKKNIKRLQRVQRENTTEMILEPIKDFVSDQYEQAGSLVEDWNEDEVIEQSKRIEGNINNFFKDASVKVNFLGEVAYIFEQLAVKHKDNVNNLN